MIDTQVIDLIVDQAKNDEKHQLVIRSKAFWGKLKVQHRTPQTVVSVQRYLIKCGLMIIPNGFGFGKERSETRIRLRLTMVGSREWR